MVDKLKVAIFMEKNPAERKKTKPNMLEVVESPNYTLKDLTLKNREVKKQVEKMVTDMGYQIRSLSVVADPEADYDVSVVVMAPIFGTSKKKPVKRIGPQGGGIGRSIKR